MHCVSVLGGNHQGCHRIVFVAVTFRWNTPSAAQVVLYHRSDTMTSGTWQQSCSLKYVPMSPLNLTFNLWQEKHYYTEPPTLRMEPGWMSRCLGHRAFGETGMSMLSLMYMCSTLLHLAITEHLSLMWPTDVMRISKREAMSRELEKLNMARLYH